MLYVQYRKVQRLKKALDVLVYGSTVIDAAILAITLMAASKMIDPTYLLFEMNVMLSIVVALSAVVGALFLLMKNYDRVIRWCLVTQHRAKFAVSKSFGFAYDLLAPPDYKYKRLRFRLFSLMAAGISMLLVDFADGMRAVAEAAGLLKKEVMLENWPRHEKHEHVNLAD